MAIVYICLFLGWSYLCFWIGKRIERANKNDTRLYDIYRADSVVNNASSDFDRMYAKKHKRKLNV